jgi:hypothetical protein
MIALDALLKLVAGQVIQKLGEDGLSGIHPSLSAISVVGSHLPIAAGSADVIFKSKNESYKLKSVLCDDYGRRCDFSRTLLGVNICNVEPLRGLLCKVAFERTSGGFYSGNRIW